MRRQGPQPKLAGNSPCTGNISGIQWLSRSLIRRRPSSRIEAPTCECLSAGINCGRTRASHAFLPLEIAGCLVRRRTPRYQLEQGTLCYSTIGPKLAIHTINSVVGLSLPLGTLEDYKKKKKRCAAKCSKMKTFTSVLSFSLLSATTKNHF